MAVQSKFLAVGSAVPFAAAEVGAIATQALANVAYAMLYLDVGANWNYSDKTQFYVNVDNIANTRPPDIGSQDNNQVVYDVIGRMFRVGVRFNN